MVYLEKKQEVLDREQELVEKEEYLAKKQVVLKEYEKDVSRNIIMSRLYILGLIQKKRVPR